MAGVHGTCASGFEAVRRAFEHNFAEHGEVGAAVAVTVNGELVVDLWGGDADAKGRPWERDTIVNTYSTTKGMTATCAHMLADRGLIDLDAPVTRYWPEFENVPKDGMPVRYLLSHQAGLPVIDEPLPDASAADWDFMVGALERQAPIWEPGAKQGYHAVTFGWLVGEVIRRVSGRSVGTFLREEVTSPLGADFFIGVPESEDHRVATMLRATPPGGAGSRRTPREASREATRATGTAGDRPAPREAPPSPRPNAQSLPLMARALNLASPPIAPRNNSREWRAAEVPGANGHGDARALATVYGALGCGGEINGIRLLSPEAVERAARVVVEGPDEVLFSMTRRSLGFMLPAQAQDVRPQHAFGHGGAGGSMGFCDTEARVGFGYVMNQMWGGGLMQPDPRAQGLVRALYESLA